LNEASAGSSFTFFFNLKIDRQRLRIRFEKLLGEKMKEFFCDAVLLDMDGTLVDSTDCVIRQWRRWAERHGLPLERILSVSHGCLTLDAMRIVAPHLANTEQAEAFDQAEVEDVDGIKAVNGASAFLGDLRDNQWAIVTSASRELARVRLLAAGLPIPKVLISSDDIRAGKPDPEGYLKAAELLRAAPKQCLVVEDSVAGVQAARRAGMFVLGITTTFPAEQLNADTCIADFLAVRIDKEKTHEGIRILVSSA
jgi:mannitol-1-/sugar-/sorbitol-6-phosphatase